jgi:hypothetical protein
MSAGDGLDEAFAPEFLASDIRGFRDAVTVDDHQVVRLQLDGLGLIPVDDQQTQHWPSDL